jgi:hypothetical protein
MEEDPLISGADPACGSVIMIPIQKIGLSRFDPEKTGKNGKNDSRHHRGAP